MKKYRVLIADDEYLILQGLKVLIDWSLYNCEIVAEADDGRKCLAMIEQYHPDIVITDIRMPNLSGIDLIRMTPPQCGCHFIILSGYSDFEYARQCMALGVREYLLKPVEEELLIGAILRIQQQIEDEAARNTEFQNLAEQKEKVEQLSRDYFLRDFVNSYFDEADDLQSLLKREKLSIPANAFYCCVLLDMPGQRDGIHAFRNQIKGVLDENFKNDPLVFHYEEESYMVILTFQEEPIHKELVKRMEGVRKKISGCAKCRVTIGMGECFREMYKIPVSARQAQLAMAFRIVHGEDSVNSFSVGLENAHFIQAIPKTLISEFCSLITTLNHYEISKSLKKIFSMEALKNMPLLGVQINAINLILICIKSVEEMNARRPPIRYEMLDCFEQIARLESKKQIEAYVENVIYTLISGIQRAEAPKTSELMVHVQEYLRDHVFEDISLVTVAQVFFMSPIYLSRRFKKETGLLYVDYVTSLKMNVAKQLLLDSNLMIYEIANKLGYRDVKYFSQLFRGKWGASPTEYRKKAGQ